jgi:hypothetical protein
LASANQKQNLETQRDEAATKTLTAEVAGGAEDAEKQRQGDILQVRKSSRAAKTLRISTAEEAEVLGKSIAPRTVISHANENAV